MEQTFSAWLVEKGIDCQTMTAELRAALVAQWVTEQLTQQQSIIVIPDGCDSDQWQRAIRLEVPQ